MSRLPVASDPLFEPVFDPEPSIPSGSLSKVEGRGSDPKGRLSEPERRI
jgi:hypothetical protein